MEVSSVNGTVSCLMSSSSSLSSPFAVAPTQSQSPSHLVSDECDGGMDDSRRGGDDDEDASVVVSTWSDIRRAEMHSMSSFEQDEVIQDMGGKNLLAAAEPSLLTTLGLNNMHEQVQRMQKLMPLKGDEERTLLKSPLLEDDDFLLRFWRADRTDASKAVRRLVRYLRLTSDVFDPTVALSRPIRLDDLDAQDLKLLESGWMQLLPGRDVAGRRVVTLDGVQGYSAGEERYQKDDCQDAVSTTKSKIRVAIYIFQAASLDLDTQKQGLQLVLHRMMMMSSSNESTCPDDWVTSPYEQKLFRRLFSCLPVRCSTLHTIVPKASCFRMVLPSTLTIFGRNDLARMQFHTGTLDRCHDTLRADYGIPVEWMPLTSTGRRKVKEHEQWMYIQRARESSKSLMSKHPIVECPRNTDILLTKCRRVLNHPGNLLLREVLGSKYKERKMARYKEKLSIVVMAADELQCRHHCRFLVKNDVGCWVEADREVVIEKLGNGFRFVPRFKKR